MATYEQICQKSEVFFQMALMFQHFFSPFFLTGDWFYHFFDTFWIWDYILEMDSLSNLRFEIVEKQLWKSVNALEDWGCPP